MFLYHALVRHAAGVAPSINKPLQSLVLCWETQKQFAWVMAEFVHYVSGLFFSHMLVVGPKCSSTVVTLTLVGFYIGSRPSGILQTTFCAIKWLKLFLNRVGTSNNTFNDFNAGPLLLNGGKKPLSAEIQVQTPKECTKTTDWQVSRTKDGQKVWVHSVSKVETALWIHRIIACRDVDIRFFEPRPGRPQNPWACAVASYIKQHSFSRSKRLFR